MPCGRTRFHVPGQKRPPVHWHLFENLPGPTLPAREPGESVEDYQRRLGKFTAAWSGRRARRRRGSIERRRGVIA